MLKVEDSLRDVRYEHTHHVFSEEHTSRGGYNVSEQISGI